MLSIAGDTEVYKQVRAARILVVEEDLTIAIMLDDALNDFGYHVLGPVENIEAAVYLAATEKIDAAVVDPNFSGKIVDTIADRLFERGVPFVFVNRHRRLANHSRREITPLRKSFTIDDLEYAVARMLRQSV
jgi:DNA-binding response OmpR family regulator